MKKSLKTILLLMATIGFATPTLSNQHWGYDGDDSPENWAKLTSDYQMCALGKNQSPVNISHTVHVKINNLKVHYDSLSGNIVNNGHTIQINNENPSNYIIINKEKYTLIQFHFHAPSENQINSKSYPMEAHFVHQNDKGELLVMAIMVDEGKQNMNTEELLTVLNPQENMPTRLNDIKISGLIPKTTHYYRFSGSLTTPPCTEGIVWVVLKKPATFSKTEIEKFEQVFKHHNNRPIQPLFGRLIIDN